MYHVELTHGSLGRHESNGTLIGSAVFAQLTSVTNTQITLCQDIVEIARI